jgi:hypothetical protein
MKVRMLAAISILSLAAWFPLQAQQSAAPADPAQKSQAPAASSPSEKASAKHDCCCAAKDTSAPTAAANPDSQSKGCCHGKTAGEAKASCCDGKDAKNMSCCGKLDPASTSAMGCCQGMKDAQCSAKGAKSCCNGKSAQSAKVCCTGMADHCQAPASGK